MRARHEPHDGVGRSCSRHCASRSPSASTPAGSWAVTSRSHCPVASALGVWILLEVPRSMNRDLSIHPACPVLPLVPPSLGIAWLLARTAHHHFGPAYVVARVRLSTGGGRGRMAAAHAHQPHDVHSSPSCSRSRGALFFLRAEGAVVPRMPRRSFAVWLACVAGVLALGQQSAPCGAVGHQPDPRADRPLARNRERRTEELLYAQAERIEAAVTAMAVPAMPGPSLFSRLRGRRRAAGVRGGDRARSERVHERYAIGDRRLLLVNDRRDYDRHPLASPSALARAIHGIAARMDREQDVLFLALSSHGRKRSYLVITNGALPLDELTGEDLARMLNESGIRWKVLVISACYSGAFIEHLRDDQHHRHHGRRARQDLVRLQRPPRAHLFRRGFLS